MQILKSKKHREILKKNKEGQFETVGKVRKT